MLTSISFLKLLSEGERAIEPSGSCVSVCVFFGSRGRQSLAFFFFNSILGFSIYLQTCFLCLQVSMICFAQNSKLFLQFSFFSFKVFFQVFLIFEKKQPHQKTKTRNMMARSLKTLLLRLLNLLKTFATGENF